MVHCGTNYRSAHQVAYILLQPLLRPEERLKREIHVWLDQRRTFLERQHAA